MAAAKTKKRSIIIGNKEYTMPQKMSTMAYLRYLEVRDRRRQRRNSEAEGRI